MGGAVASIGSSNKGNTNGRKSAQLQLSFGGFSHLLVVRDALPLSAFGTNDVGCDEEWHFKACVFRHYFRRVAISVHSTDLEDALFTLAHHSLGGNRSLPTHICWDCRNGAGAQP